jgi:hypothetical protein
MIYPDVSLEKWLEKYPGLNIIEVECLDCHGIIRTETPFMTKDYIGLSVSTCPNCHVSHKACTAMPYSKQEKEL